MVYVHELREGNWIKSETELFGKKSWNEWQVNIEDFEHIKNNPENYFGIPITEDIFKKIIYQLFEVKFYSKYINRRITIILNEKLSIQSEYLHELQNLYFALTKKELIL